MDKKQRVNKIIILVLGIIIILLIGVVFLCVLKLNMPKDEQPVSDLFLEDTPKDDRLVLDLFLKDTPKDEQLMEDLVSEEFGQDEFSLMKFEIEDETDGENKDYFAIVSVTYNDGVAEHNEKYQLEYKKYSEWILEDIEEYEKDDWTIRPLMAPTLEEFEKRCIDKLDEDGKFTEYDSIIAVEDKTEVNLEEGKTTFVFEVEYSTPLQLVSGEIEFLIQFDYQRGKWNIEGYKYLESYKIEYNLQHCWSGQSTYNGHIETKDDGKEVTLNITEFNKETASGILLFDGKQYPVSGTIDLPQYVGYNILIDLYNTSEKMRIEGVITRDGVLGATVDTAYVPDAYLYYPKDRYSVLLYIEE